MFRLTTVEIFACDLSGKFPGAKLDLAQHMRTCWSLGHAEQLLFSCLCSKVSICIHVTCLISHVTCHMLYVKCLCWSLGHAEQLLFSFVSWKVTACHGVTCHMANAYDNIHEKLFWSFFKDCDKNIDLILEINIL